MEINAEDGNHRYVPGLIPTSRDNSVQSNNNHITHYRTLASEETESVDAGEMLKRLNEGREISVTVTGKAFREGFGFSAWKTKLQGPRIIL